MVNSDENVVVGEKAFVWDLPTRLFHWALAIAVAVSLISEEMGRLDLHLISGHVVFGLVIFRIIWGLIGGRHARFSDFVTGPKAVIDYVKSLISGNAREYPGHNPMGALSVIAILLVLLAQAGTGFFANDDIFTEGPLVSLVSKSTSDYLTYIHGLISNVVYALIVLHFAAILFYTYKGHGLIGAMVTGRKKDRDFGSRGGKLSGNILLAVIAAAVATAAGYGVYTY